MQAAVQYSSLSTGPSSGKGTECRPPDELDLDMLLPLALAFGTPLTPLAASGPAGELLLRVFLTTLITFFLPEEQSRHVILRFVYATYKLPNSHCISAIGPAPHCIGGTQNIDVCYVAW